MSRPVYLATVGIVGIIAIVAIVCICVQVRIQDGEFGCSAISEHNQNACLTAYAMHLANPEYDTRVVNHPPQFNY